MILLEYIDFSEILTLENMSIKIHRLIDGSFCTDNEGAMHIENIDLWESKFTLITKRTNYSHYRIITEQ